MGDRIGAGLQWARVCALIAALVAKCVFLLLLVSLLGMVLVNLVAHADTDDPLAHTVCKALYSGMSFDQTVEALLEDNPGKPREETRLTVAMAIGMQCPSQIGKVPGDIQDMFAR